MTRPSADRVKVEWSGTGTGTITLGAAVSGFQTFPSALNGQVVSYSIEHQTSSEAEAGYGTYTSSGTTLTRFYRTYPTLGGAAVNFSAGTKHVRITAIAADIAANLATSNPAVTDDIAAGYRVGNLWVNTSTPSAWICLNATAAAAVWAQIDGTGSGAVSSVNGETGAVLLDAFDIHSSRSPTNYSLAAGSPTNISIDGHLAGIDTALGALSVGTDAAPTQVTSNASPFALTTAARLHNNVEVLSHTTSVDFEVATTAAAGSKWYIRFIHDGCTVSVNTDVGSINGVAGAAARGINGGVGIIEVASNAGTAPVVLVRGDIIMAPTAVGGTKTYDNDDSEQDFELTTTSTQTFGAAAGFTDGFFVNLFVRATGSTTIDGVDRDYTAVAPDVVTIKKLDISLWAFGKAGVISLDDA